MSKLGYAVKRAMKMDWKKMRQTADMLHEKTGKSRAWLMQDMLRCALRYNAGYMDYKIAAMYNLNDAQRRTVITRGISNNIVRRMNDKAYWHYFDDKTTFNTLFAPYGISFSQSALLYLTMPTPLEPSRGLKSTAGRSLRNSASASAVRLSSTLIHLRPT